MNQLFLWGIENATRNENQGFSEEEQEARKQELQQIPRKFLDAILRSEASKMKVLVDIFTGNTKEAPTFEEKIVALEELEFLLQIIDNANDLHHPTVDGLVPLLKGVKSELGNDPEFRMRCCWALATALQNNPKVQSQVMELGGVQTFLDALNKELSSNITSNNPNEQSMHLQLLSKIIFCLSSLLTHNKEAQKQFWKSGGFQTLNTLLNSIASHLTSLSQEKITPKTESEDSIISPDEEVIRTENGGVIINVVDIEDKVKDKAQQLKKIREANPEVEPPSVVWLRLGRRTIFMLTNLIVESEELKLVVVKDNNGALLRTLLDVLESQEDLELKETIVRLLDSLTTSSSQKMQEYIVDVIKNLPLKDVLGRQKERLNDTDNEEITSMINNIVGKIK